MEGGTQRTGPPVPGPRPGGVCQRAARAVLLCLACLAAVAAPSLARADALPPGKTRTAYIQKETPEERLARGRQAYLRNDFPGAVSAIHELLYPEIQLRSDTDVQSAHRLLALAYFLDNQTPAAEREFRALMQLNPNFSLDSLSDPPRAVAFLEQLQQRERQRITEIEARRLAEAQESERRRKEDEERIRKTLKPVTVLVEHHSFAVNFVPFGVGQFQNGERAKGYAFLGSQFVLGATSLALWAALQIQYDSGKLKVPVPLLPDGTEDHSAKFRADAMGVTSVVAGGLFWVDVGWGIIDAIIHYKALVPVADPNAPASRTPPPPPRATLGPFTPNGGGFGLSLQGAF